LRAVRHFALSERHNRQKRPDFGPVGIGGAKDSDASAGTRASASLFVLGAYFCVSRRAMNAAASDRRRRFSFVRMLLT
jgi:hypothetical protein